MIKTEDFVQKTLYEQLKIKENIEKYDILYIGDSYPRASAIATERFVERYGNNETSLHVSPENMEMAVEQGGEIRSYCGENFTDEEGGYIALVKKQEGKK